MRHSKMIWIVVVTLALLTFVVVAGAVSRARDVQPLVVAARSLAVGQRLTTSDVEIREMASSAVLPGAFATLEEVLGQTVAVPRAPGDQLTAATLGEGINSLVAALPPDWRAVGIEVDEAQGLAGLLRPGDTVGLVAYLEPQRTMVNVVGGTLPDTNALAVEDSPQARLALSGLQVLFVPQEFRYVEQAATGEQSSSGLAGAQRRDRTGVVVLAAPATPVTMTIPLSLTGTTTETVRVTPVELLALLNDSGQAQIHLVLEPDNAQPAVALGVALDDLLLYQRRRSPVEAR